MATNREKVQIFLASVINNCKLKEPFKMNDVTRRVGITSNAGTIIKRLGLIERSHNRGEVGHEWVWKATGLESLPQLTEIVSRAIDGYQSTFTNAGRKQQQADSISFPGAHQNNELRQTHAESRQEEIRHVNAAAGIGNEVYIQHPALAGCMEPGFTGNHLGPDSILADDAQGVEAEAAAIDLPAALADIQRKVDAIYCAVMPPVPCGS